MSLPVGRAVIAPCSPRAPCRRSPFKRQNIFYKGKTGIWYLKSENNDPVSLRKAFEDAITVLGESTKQSMIYELTAQAGLNFADGSLTAAKLHEGLALLYGKDTADIILEEVLLKIDRVASQQLDRK